MGAGPVSSGDNHLILNEKICEKPFCQARVGAWEGGRFSAFSQFSEDIFLILIRFLRASRLKPKGIQVIRLGSRSNVEGGN